MLARPRFFIQDIRPVLPRFRSDQASSLNWLAAAHALACERNGQADSASNLLRLATRFGCGPEKISTRWHELPDFSERPADSTLVGAPLSRKMEFYTTAMNRVFSEFYPDELKPEHAPAELIHVSCTGYRSPSAAQVRVAQLGWGEQTRVTHAYHMGCYAAIPALRLAQGAGLRELFELQPGRAIKRIEVAHTEICSLHFRPGVTQADQWVIQSLFADGFVRYSFETLRDGVDPLPARDSLELLGTDEVVVPGTADQMTWVPEESGFAMTLGREVPREISRGVGPFVERLLGRVGVAPLATLERGNLFFAIHPGGPKIVDAVEEVLGLEPIQSLQSRDVLRERGNLSAATLPHIWLKILEQTEVRTGALVVSLAFGPGLTLCGSVFRVHRGTSPGSAKDLQR